MGLGPVTLSHVSSVPKAGHPAGVQPKVSRMALNSQESQCMQLYQGLLNPSGLHLSLGAGLSWKNALCLGAPGHNSLPSIAPSAVLSVPSVSGTELTGVPSQPRTRELFP